MDQSGSSGRRSRVRLYGIPAALAVLLGAAVFWDQGARRPVPAPIAMPSPALAPIPASPYRNTDPGVAYVGDEVCARCHAEIARTYREHPMGRSMSQAPGGGEPEGDGVVFTAGDLSYSVLHRGGKVFHREQRHDAQGRPVAAVEAMVRYVLGSGRRGLAFLAERDGGLYQSPIAWYAEGRRWGLAPLYEMQNLHFNRSITPGCLFCHTNRFEGPAGRTPVFHGLAIGCERCHGPGALHARRPEAIDGHDRTIVNPADLEPRSLREAICEQCHLQGSSRRNQPDRTAFDYRPGLPFDAFVLVSDARGDPISRLRAVGHVEQMRQSRCYQESGGELGCISCHDPHRLPDPKERVGYYRGRCQECHAQRGCSLPPQARRVQQPDDDCTACHMPRSPAADIAHTAITLHTIPRPSPATR
jgi:hypothetical protein